MKNGTILLVEDNADDVALTLDAFRQCRIGNDVFVAQDGAAAMEYLFSPGGSARHPPQLPVLVLLDLKLPKIDGMDVLRRIRAEKRTRRLPVVVLTSSNQTQDINDCYDLGANSYVRKPVSFDEFLEVAQQLGRYWLLINESPTTE